MHSFAPWATVILVQIVSVLPSILVVVFGLYLAYRHWGDQRRRSVLVSIAMAMLLASPIVSLLLTFLLREQMRFDGGMLGMIALRLVTSLPFAVAIMLLLYAVYYGDDRPPYEDVDAEEHR